MGTTTNNLTAERFTTFGAAPEILAPRLLGQRLVRRLDGHRRAGIIVEVEAYLGVPDKAAHTYGGRRTPRNESMYLPGGHLYVYFTYGMHHCINVVCGRRDEGVAVLIRALQPVEGLDSMRVNRPRARGETDLCSGPARLAQALGIDRRHDGLDLTASDEIFIERMRSRPLPDTKIVRTPRIGIDYAEEWAERPLRYCLRDTPHLSRRIRTHR